MKPFIFFFSVLVVGAAAMFLFVLPDLRNAAPVPANASRPSASDQQPMLPPIDLSPRERYIDLMLKFQYRFEDAFHAGVCGLRSEGYFTAFRVAQSTLSSRAAQQLGLSQNEVGVADVEVNQRFAKIHEGVPEFNLTEGCAYLRFSQRMVELDNFYRQITVDYR
jgi:hypothetical protein